MLPEYKRILYATDLSRNSAYAYTYAMSLASKYGASIAILHVLEDMGPWDHEMLENYIPKCHKNKIINDAIANIKKRLQVLCDKYKDDLPAHGINVDSILVYEGNPAEEILKQAKKTGADLILLGSHGKGTSTHPFFGSVARKVVGLSRIPVTVVPIPSKKSDLSFYDF